jgi:hypothetical protein
MRERLVSLLVLVAGDHSRSMFSNSTVAMLGAATMDEKDPPCVIMLIDETRGLCHV